MPRTFEQMAYSLGWRKCKACKTIVANVDKNGYCNPPCYRCVKPEKKKSKKKK